jgi:uncharacterized membrane protein (DUF4010 family)
VDLTIFQQLGVATALGALIGLERERKHHIEHYVDSYAGIRTYALIALAGSLAYILSIYSMIFFAVVSAGIMVLLIMGYVLGVKKHGGLGMTSEIASVLVYMIGILCGMQLFVVATMVSLLVLTFLLLKTPLHNWAKKIKYEELVSALEFLIVAFVVLPILPNENYGPYGFFNPYSIWLLVVFISGISFVSYVAIKFLGTKKGLTLTGFLAGFISTTALAFSLSAQSKKNVKVVVPYVLAMIVASFAMLLRILIEVFVLNFDLISLLLIPVLSMFIVGVVVGLFLWKRNSKVIERVDSTESIHLSSPFSLVPALKFALFFVLILFLSEFAVHNMGAGGLYLTGFFSGFVDVDAITVSMSNLSKIDLNKEVAMRVIMVTVIVNTLVKAGIFFVFGTRKVAKDVGLVFIFMSFAGILSLFLV